jgi:hypothetical protein
MHMRKLWLVSALGVAVLVGCKSKPRREMGPPKAEEFSIPPDRLNTPPDYPRDNPVLTPKANGPGAMPGPGIGSPSGPGTSPGGMRR